MIITTAKINASRKQNESIHSTWILCIIQGIQVVYAVLNRWALEADVCERKVENTLGTLASHLGEFFLRFILLILFRETRSFPGAKRFLPIIYPHCLTLIFFSSGSASFRASHTFLVTSVSKPHSFPTFLSLFSHFFYLSSLSTLMWERKERRWVHFWSGHLCPQIAATDCALHLLRYLLRCSFLCRLSSELSTYASWRKPDVVSTWLL